MTMGNEDISSQNSVFLRATRPLLVGTVLVIVTLLHIAWDGKLLPAVHNEFTTQVQLGKNMFFLRGVSTVLPNSMDTVKENQILADGSPQVRILSAPEENSNTIRVQQNLADVSSEVHVADHEGNLTTDNVTIDKTPQAQSYWTNTPERSAPPTPKEIVTADGTLFDVAVVGAGPNAIRFLARLAEHKKVKYIAFDKGEIADTIRNWYVGSVTHSPRDFLGVGREVPMDCTSCLDSVWQDGYPNISSQCILDGGKFRHCGRDQYVKYLTDAVRKLNLKVHTYERVVGVIPFFQEGDRQKIFKIHTQQTRSNVGADGKGAVLEYFAKYVVLAMGESSFLRDVYIPGMHLPHVERGVTDPESYKGKKIVLIGCGASGIEMAARLVNYGSVHVTQLCRRIPPKLHSLIEFQNGWNTGTEKEQSLMDRLLYLRQLERKGKNIYFDASAQRLMHFIQTSRYNVHWNLNVDGIEEKHVLANIQDGGNVSIPTRIEADKVILALGYNSDKPLLQSLRILRGGVTKKGETNRTGVYACALTRTLKGGVRAASLHTDIEDSKGLVNDVADTVLGNLGISKELVKAQRQPAGPPVNAIGQRPVVGIAPDNTPKTPAACLEALNPMKDPKGQVIPRGALGAEGRMFMDKSVVKVGAPGTGELECYKAVAKSVLEITSRDFKQNMEQECGANRDKIICNADFYSAWFEPPDEYSSFLQTIHELQQSGLINKEAQVVLKWDVTAYQSSWESFKPLANSVAEFLETEFQVTLYSSPNDHVPIGQQIGLKFQPLESSLRVRDISKGSLADNWNEKNTALEIKKKHCVVEVNGVRGSGKDLEEAMKAPGMLRMTVVRPSKMMSCESREVIKGQRRSFVVGTFETSKMTHFAAQS
eukprot:gnl/MRDRNA2_/MRDRNA2_91512_c0_seq1.p1 gnl/MRDRNA2_/MRDRNA2_91512_c0~~gnl/MRDRNA2_/MRDRNA2_91512_c0_seq1.p1  ORF type:complete len:878 (-),score=129.04 gnl/MRDRNA2_/MRDRNA2_91512_c0_seq1:143-2776(-)